MKTEAEINFLLARVLTLIKQIKRADGDRAGPTVELAILMQDEDVRALLAEAGFRVQTN